MTLAPPPSTGVDSIELGLLLEAVWQRYGFDFRGYAKTSIRRRILGQVQAEGLASISGLQEKVRHDPAAMERLLSGLTVHVTSMFRDPGFYLAFRQKVVPLLGTYPFVRLWHAGCSRGEEVYSMAILLREEGLAERCRSYATDLSEAVLARAREGIFPLGSMKDFTVGYQRAGGTGEFSEYYATRFDLARMRPSLRDNVVFATHNLATDGSFNEFNVILCRNVMIDFGPSLQAWVHGLLFGSLCRLGLLALGRRELLRSIPHEACYEPLDEHERLYRRVV